MRDLVKLSEPFRTLVNHYNDFIQISAPANQCRINPIAHLGHQGAPSKSGWKLMK